MVKYDQEAAQRGQKYIDDGRNLVVVVDVVRAAEVASLSEQSAGSELANDPSRGADGYAVVG